MFIPRLTVLRHLEINKPPFLQRIFACPRSCYVERIAEYVTNATRTRTNKKASKVDGLFVSSCLIISLISFTVLATEKGPNLGKQASPALIKQWDIDIFPNGKGLPKGQGTSEAGEKVYQKHCISCHGVEGIGNSADELAGATHSLTDNPPDKTIGTYWPYTTTLFDFTRRAMPLYSPGILTDNDVYAVTAYLLYLNGIIDKAKVINANTLAKIKMPNRNGFINTYNMGN